MIEQTLLGLLILFPIGLVIYRSPLLTWVFVLLLMLVVYLAAIGGATFVTLMIHIPKQNYGAAAISIVLGVFCSGLVVLPTWGYFVSHIRDLKRSTTLWS